MLIDYIQLLCTSIRDYRSKPVFSVERDVEFSGLVGLESYNFREVHVDQKFESVIFHVYIECHCLASICRCASSPHDNWWWPVIILSLWINALWGIYLCPLKEMIRRPDAVVNILWVPECKKLIHSKFITVLIACSFQVWITHLTVWFVVEPISNRVMRTNDPDSV